LFKFSFSKGKKDKEKQTSKYLTRIKHAIGTKKRDSKRYETQREENIRVFYTTFIVRKKGAEKSKTYIPYSYFLYCKSRSLFENKLVFL
jgi:hypothetical protein